MQTSKNLKFNNEEMLLEQIKVIKEENNKINKEMELLKNNLSKIEQENQSNLKKVHIIFKFLI